jgi:hypothetical protein
LSSVRRCSWDSCLLFVVHAWARRVDALRTRLSR